MRERNTATEFRFGYYNDPDARRALCTFASEMFDGLDFCAWNDLGFSFSEYTPFSFFENGRVVANVSASPMNLVIEGRSTPAIQIGTVASLPSHGGRGLIRELMAKARKHWEETHPLFFLFTNPSSQHFYEQFGYRRVFEMDFSAEAPICKFTSKEVRRIDLNRAADRELLKETADNRSPVSARLGVEHQSWLLLFHAAMIYPQFLFFIGPLSVTVICLKKEQTLHLIDVIGTRVPPLEEIYPFIGSPEIMKIEFGFTPDLMEVKNLEIRPSPDSPAFVSGPFEIERDPFRFPVTAQA